mmetsp:Transcript_53144/g.125594  ORF Transcript_53144/g.125594 Transcript_53144/m.125594 type:complete len:319 (-) Transcript_53144:2176-3132(-)
MRSNLSARRCRSIPSHQRPRSGTFLTYSSHLGISKQPSTSSQSHSKRFARSWPARPAQRLFKLALPPPCEAPGPSGDITLLPPPRGPALEALRGDNASTLFPRGCGAMETRFMLLAAASASDIPPPSPSPFFSSFSASLTWSSSLSHSGELSMSSRLEVTLRFSSSPSLFSPIPSPPSSVRTSSAPPPSSPPSAAPASGGSSISSSSSDPSSSAVIGVTLFRPPLGDLVPPLLGEPPPFLGEPPAPAGVTPFPGTGATALALTLAYGLSSRSFLRMSDAPPPLRIGDCTPFSSSDISPSGNRSWAWSIARPSAQTSCL